MSKRAYYLGLAVIAGCLMSGAAIAKVWLLPDYQGKHMYSDRASERANNTVDKGSITCASRGGVALSSLGEGQTCVSPFTIPETLQKCCSSYSCSSAYSYDDSTCDVDKKLTPKGSACIDSDGKRHYTGCGCNNSYQATEANCQYGVDATTDYCQFEGVKYYGACNNDPCLQTENVMTCAADRCQSDKVCGDNLCLKDGCDTNCEAGFDYNTGSCKRATCPTLYSTTVEGCEGAGLTLVDNSQLALGDKVSGAVGGVNCHECTVICKDGFVDYGQYWCNATLQTDCEKLGYSKPSGKITFCLNGQKKVLCPYDNSYYVCAGLADNSTNNPVCSSTELLGDKIAHAYGSSSSSTLKACHKAACKQTAINKLTISNIGTVYDLDDGGYVIATCKDKSKEVTDDNGCITGCIKKLDLIDLCANDSCPDNANCTRASSGSYYVQSCKEGWTQDSTIQGTYGSCVVCKCDGYTSLEDACNGCPTRKAKLQNGCYICSTSNNDLLRCPYIDDTPIKKEL